RVQPPEEQRPESAACLQHRPGEVEGLLLSLADRLYYRAVTGTGESAASAGAAAGQTHSGGVVRQPEEHRAAVAGEWAATCLASGELRQDAGSGPPHQSGGHLVDR